MNRDKYITPLSTRYVSPEMNANFGDNKKVMATVRQPFDFVDKVTLR